MTSMVALVVVSGRSAASGVRLSDITFGPASLICEVAVLSEAAGGSCDGWPQPCTDSMMVIRTMTQIVLNVSFFIKHLHKCPCRY